MIVATKNTADPNFLLIGAQKSGTSWLAKMLDQHPDVLTARNKELHFFNREENYRRGLEWYREQFCGYAGQKAVGECTPNYLWVTNPPKSVSEELQALGGRPLHIQDSPETYRQMHHRIRQYYPEVKFLVSLRNPITRAISAFYHSIRRRRVAPRSRLVDVAHRYGILGMGFYYRQLCEWFDAFPRERFLILIYEEDILGDKKETIRRVYRHLGVAEDFLPGDLDGQFNVRSSDAYLYLNYYAPRVAPRLFRRMPWLHRTWCPRIDVTPGERAWLYRLYRRENQRLEELLGRPLDIWATSSTDSCPSTGL